VTRTLGRLTKQGVLLLASLVALHVGAALRHALLLRDGVMRRILPWKPRRND